MIEKRKGHRVKPRRYRWMRPDVWGDAPGRIWTVLWSYPTQQVEVWAAIGAILRGAWWLQRYETGGYKGDVATEFISIVVPIWLLGLGLILAGTAQLLAVAMRYAGARRAAAACVAGSAAFVLITQLAVDSSTQVIPLLAMIVLMEIFAILRIGPWTDWPFGEKRERSTQ